MKYFPFLLLALFLFAASCKKDPTIPIVQHYPDSSFVKLNGVELTAPIKGSFASFTDTTKSHFDIEISKYDSGFYMMYWLMLDNLNLTKASQNVYYSFDRPYDASNANFWLMNNNEVVNKYSILNSDSTNNQLFIDSYDPYEQIVKGRFHFSMYRIDSSSAPAIYGFPDTLRFTDGYFNLKITR